MKREKVLLLLLQKREGEVNGGEWTLVNRVLGKRRKVAAAVTTRTAVSLTGYILRQLSLFFTLYHALQKFNSLNLTKIMIII